MLKVTTLDGLIAYFESTDGVYWKLYNQIEPPRTAMPIASSTMSSELTKEASKDELLQKINYLSGGSGMLKVQKTPKCTVAVKIPFSISNVQAFGFSKNSSQINGFNQELNTQISLLKQEILRIKFQNELDRKDAEIASLQNEAKESKKNFVSNTINAIGNMGVEYPQLTDFYAGVLVTALRALKVDAAIGSVLNGIPNDNQVRKIMSSEHESPKKEAETAKFDVSSNANNPKKQELTELINNLNELGELFEIHPNELVRLLLKSVKENPSYISLIKTSINI